MEQSESLHTRFKAAFGVIAAVLAFWAAQGVLRFAVLFRDNPYGSPFVAKPDWYIFHALCIDYIWIAEMALPFLLLALLLPVPSRGRRFVTPVFCVLQSIILPFTILDHEFQRFLGTHFSISLLDTYKDASSLAILPEYVSSDQSIPYLQWILLVGIIPLALFLYKIIFKAFARRNIRLSLLRGWLIGCVAFFGFSELFLNVIWKGTNRMRKLAPVVQIVSNDLQEILFGGVEVDPQFIKAATEASRRVWAEVEGEGADGFEYPDDEFPMYRVPVVDTAAVPVADTAAVANDMERVRPNFVLIFLESQRGLNVGFMNPSDTRPSPTPVMDSLARTGRAWTRFYASGVPTVGGVLSTHLGFPTHRFKSTATELAHIDAPSFASILRDAGYKAHFFAAADPAWDNLSVWFQKWYDRTHYDRAYEDDSTFFDVTAKFICDSLAPMAGKDNAPFVAAMITRSNHYPFNLVPGMPDSAKALSQADRMRFTMHWADAQMGRFINTLAKQDWFKNTYLIVMGDHGFPQGEHGVSAIGSEAYSNVTWIPFVLNGPGIVPEVQDSVAVAFTNLDSAAASQVDVAPTILSLAGVKAANSFMGHNLLRDSRTAFAVGAHSGKIALSLDSLRLLANAGTGDSSSNMLFLYKADVEENENLSSREAYKQATVRFKSLADTLLGLNDWILMKNRVQKP